MTEREQRRLTAIMPAVMLLLDKAHALSLESQKMFDEAMREGTDIRSIRRAIDLERDRSMMDLSETVMRMIMPREALLEHLIRSQPK